MKWAWHLPLTMQFIMLCEPPQTARATTSSTRTLPQSGGTRSSADPCISRTVFWGSRRARYGDFSGLAVKISENFTIQMLLEKYATQHAVGAVAYMELDSKAENAQKIAALKMAASA